MYTTMLAWSEEMTKKEDEAVHHRIFSWWILVRTWCTLRFSDHRSVSPQEVQAGATGLVTILRRSKTIGSDKSNVSRPLVLDGSCFVKERHWLVTGWRVLQEAASFERDHLSPAPSVNLRGCRRAELKNDQGYALLRELKLAISKMFQHPVTNFWIPYSGRAYMPTATQALVFPKEERDFLGWWLAQASDRYARTARRNIANMQRTVAQEIKTKSAGRLAEETLRSLQDFLEPKELPEAERNEYVKRLEDWSSFATDALPAGPQLEQQEEGDEAVQEFETVLTERLERQDKRRNQQNARTGILGGNTDLAQDHDEPLASRADAGARVRRTPCCKKKAHQRGQDGYSAMGTLHELRARVAEEAIRLTMEEGCSIKGALRTAYKNEHQRALDYVDRSHECPLDPRSLRQQEDGSVRTEHSQTRAETCAGKVTFTQEKQSTNCSLSPKKAGVKSKVKGKGRSAAKNQEGGQSAPSFRRFHEFPPAKKSQGNQTSASNSNNACARQASATVHTSALAVDCGSTQTLHTSDTSRFRLQHPPGGGRREARGGDCGQSVIRPS